MPLTPLYPVRVVGTPNVDHPMLSATAKALSNDALAAETMVAETALGLYGTAYTEDAKDRATLAVVRQINLQVSGPVDSTVQSETRGERSVTYVVRNGVETAVDAIALQIVEALAAAAAILTQPTPRFAPFQSVR